MKAEERVLTPDDLSNDSVDIAKVTLDDRGGVMFIGSLSADDMVEWMEARDGGGREEKKNASARLIIKSLVRGPDKNADGTELTADQRKAAALRVGTEDMVPKFKRAKHSKTERLLKAIFKLNSINQKDEEKVKND